MTAEQILAIEFIGTLNSYIEALPNLKITLGTKRDKGCFQQVHYM